MEPANGRSLHIGLNRVNPEHYEGWEGTLAGCEYDANDMESIAKSKGFSTNVLLTEAASSDAVVEEIGKAAEALSPGDIFFLTYSGHGGQVPDLNGDDDWDRFDETWVLFDRQLVDDELYALWGTFASGVRIIVLSDSCHSGSVTRASFYAASPVNETAGSVFKNLPHDIQDKTYEEHKEQYDAIQTDNPQGDNVGVGASVLLISGCMDNQFSRDGERNGLFTQTLKEVWNDGSFSGSYQSFRNEIVDRMPSDQTPNYFRVGQVAPLFEQQIPFTI